MASDLHTASPSELKQRLEAERQGKPFLVYRDGDGVQCIFSLGPSARLTVGRRPANDLALSFDANVSGVHGAFERTGDVYVAARRSRPSARNAGPLASAQQRY